jgi:hypothetical protein
MAVLGPTSRSLAPPSHGFKGMMPMSKNLSRGSSNQSNQSNNTNLTSGTASTTVRTHQRKMTVLPAEYVVGENDVLCGRGSRCFNHVGNKRFRELVEQYVPQYSCPSATKLDKSNIICEIITVIRDRTLNSGGGFVKEDLDSGLYHEVGDFLAVSSVRFRSIAFSYLFLV